MSIIERPTAGPAPAPRPRTKQPLRQRIFGNGLRPGYLTYGLLLAFFIGSAYPLWWSAVVGSRSNEALPVLSSPVAGRQFLEQRR